MKKFKITFYFTYMRNVTSIEKLTFKPKKEMTYKQVVAKVRRDFKDRLQNKNNFFDVEEY
jgi:hypothetical protein